MSSKPADEIQTPIPLDEVDQVAKAAFGDLVVEKRLARTLAARYGVPNFVAEFIVAQYCSSDDPAEVAEGLKLAESDLASKIIKSSEQQVVRHQIATEGGCDLIDQVSVIVDPHSGAYSAVIKAVGERATVPKSIVDVNDRLLDGGVYAQVRLRPSGEGKGGNPYMIESLRPIQLSRSDRIDAVIRGRGKLDTNAWKRLLVRSSGIEPDALGERQIDLFLLRMLPFVENNYNLVELGPRGTGKSYLFKDLSPNSTLISGGKTTVAQLFVNNATKTPGLVTKSDVVCFDEVSGIDFNDDAANILKDYMNDGSFARGQDRFQGRAGIVLVGNFEKDLASAQRSGHLLLPLPESLCNAAFMDRLHAYLPGWEVPKLSPALITDHHGFHADLLAAFWARLRSQSGERWLERVSFSGAVEGRDLKAVRKTAAGLLKLVYPNGGTEIECPEPGDDDIAWAVGLALEMRRRIKEQQKKIVPGREFRRTDFAFSIGSDGEMIQVGTPEGRSDSVIGSEPTNPGQVWAIGIDNEASAGLYWLETSLGSGDPGFTLIHGNQELRQEARIAHTLLVNKALSLLPEQNPKTREFVIQAQHRGGSEEFAGLSVALAISMVSAMKGNGTHGGLAIVGTCSTSGQLDPISGVVDAAEAAAQKGATRLLVPITGRAEASKISDDLATRIDVVFYKDIREAIDKAIF